MMTFLAVVEQNSQKSHQHFKAVNNIFLLQYRIDIIDVTNLILHMGQIPTVKPNYEQWAILF